MAACTGVRALAEKTSGFDEEEVHQGEKLL